MGIEIWIVIGVAALILGPTQLPKLARSIGSAKKELQDGLDGRSEHKADSATAKSHTTTVTDSATETPGKHSA